MTTNRQYRLNFTTSFRHPKRVILALAASILCSAQMPTLAVDELGWPEFRLKNGETYCAGKAFAVRWYKGRTLLVMPLHLLSPEAGCSHYVRPEDIPRELETLKILDLERQSTLATAGKYLMKTGATAGQNTGDLSADLMAFELPMSSRLTPFSLFYGQAPVGTKVTVLSKFEDSSSQPTRYTGTVSSSRPTGLVVNMDAPVTALSSSGSPVVNAKNELVGMMVGKRDDERKVIMAIPSSSMIRRMYAEIGQ